MNLYGNVSGLSTRAELSHRVSAEGPTSRAPGPELETVRFGGRESGRRADRRRVPQLGPKNLNELPFLNVFLDAFDASAMKPGRRQPKSQPMFFPPLNVNSKNATNNLRLVQ